ncbi:hypothetical protein MYD03_00155 [Mediterraneibacter gnavus]
MLFLQDYEENLSHLEEELWEGNMEDFDRKILLSRKELSVLRSIMNSYRIWGKLFSKMQRDIKQNRKHCFLAFL